MTLDAVDGLFGLLTLETARGELDVPRETIIRAHAFGRMEVDHVDQDRALASGPRWTDLPFDEAIAFFKAKRLMTADEFRRLDDSAKRQAFTVAGLQREYQLRHAHALLSDALEQGTAMGTVRKQLQDLMESAGVATKRHHLNTIFRTNVLGAYAEGRYRQARRVSKSRPFWRYVTAGDDRVRPSHAAQNGKVYPSTHDYWNTWTPPNGFSCRCSIETLSQDDVDAEQLEVQTALPDERPDRGFTGSPRQTERADTTERTVRSRVRAMKGIRQPPALAARGKKTHTSAGGLGFSRARADAGRIDRLAGLTEDQAGQLARELGEFTALPRRYGRVPRRASHVALSVPSQHADVLSQLARRIAQDSRTSSLADRIQLRPLARYRAGRATPADPTAVVPDGDQLTRHSMVQMQLTAPTTEQATALAEIMLDAEIGSGAAVRNAGEAADLVLSGAISQSRGYVSAFRVIQRRNGRQIETLRKKALAGAENTRVLITEARMSRID